MQGVASNFLIPAKLINFALLVFKKSAFNFKLLNTCFKTF